MNSSISSVLHTVSAVDTDQAFYNGSRISDEHGWAVDEKLEDVCAGDLAALWDEKAKFDDQIMAPLRSSLTQWITREAFDKAWAIFAGRPLLDTREFIEQFAMALYPA